MDIASLVILFLKSLYPFRVAWGRILPMKQSGGSAGIRNVGAQESAVAQPRITFECFVSAIGKYVMEAQFPKY